MEPLQKYTNNQSKMQTIKKKQSHYCITAPLNVAFLIDLFLRIINFLKVI